MKNNIYIENLEVDFTLKNTRIKVLRGLDLNIEEGAITGILGESGSGKSVLANSILNLLPPYTKISGKILYKNKNLLTSHKEIPGFYGKEFGLIPQYPGESLNPSMTIFKQFTSSNRKLSSKEVRDLTQTLLTYMGFDKPHKILTSYPYELSGGMQQRVLCALTLSSSPKWILADEPTKGLDDEVKNIVIDNLKKVKNYNQASMILITHDLEVAQELCDKIVILYGGNVMEYGQNILENPKHPYTQDFIHSLPIHGFQTMKGMAPGPQESIIGCPYRPRCSSAMEICKQKIPPIFHKNARKIRCFLYD